MCQSTCVIDVCLLPCCPCTLQHFHECVCTLFGRERDVGREREKGIDTMIDSHVHVFIPNVRLCYTFIFVVVHVHVCQQVSINTLHV